MLLRIKISEYKEFRTEHNIITHYFVYVGGGGICRSMKKLPKTHNLKDNPVLQCGDDYKENVLMPHSHSNHAAQVSELHD